MRWSGAESMPLTPERRNKRRSGGFLYCTTENKPRLYTHVTSRTKERSSSTESRSVRRAVGAGGSRLTTYALYPVFIKSKILKTDGQMVAVAKTEASTTSVFLSTRVRGRVLRG